ncbi:serine hydrolase domain-containing protein [Bradyrhizobium sp.]|uniref:serine hydrolase domain-containing protein n=1 Tax=Bradyrhizobium sp. TaxID=376 RepID=UPI0025BDFCC5|nr:serine hydrolase domain-containing protein [Bradyrhizobium sp.]
MKRWRTDRATGSLVAATLALLFLDLSPHKAQAETRAPAASFSRPGLDRIGDYVRNEVVTGKIPGAVLLIQQHGKPVYLESFGVRSVATKQRMTPDTIFQIYSMSKAISSVAAMMLVDDGKLSLDDSVSKYIPAFADAKVGVDLSDEAGEPPLKLEPLRRPITIRDLLRHTSGITYGFFGETAVRKRYANPDLYNGDFDNAEFADRIARLPLADQPGTRWDYGHSTDVLGRVVEVASGQTLFQFEKQRLFDPLVMPDTGFYVPKAKWPRLAEPLPRDRFGERIHFGRRIAGITTPTLPRRWESGGAGMVGTVQDYARFLQMLLNGGALEGRRYLKSETVASMTSDQVGPETGILLDPFYFPGPTSGFGLGFAVRNQAPPGTSWPLGEYRWDGAGGSFFFVAPGEDMFVVFMVQAPSEGGRIQLALKTLIYEAMGRGSRKP